tara:strand:- start:91 stop:333 length:243 start_codon:yes stop_codon:yes gene_type:complete
MRAYAFRVHKTSTSTSATEYHIYVVHPDYPQSYFDYMKEDLAARALSPEYAMQLESLPFLFKQIDKLKEEEEDGAAEHYF